MVAQLIPLQQVLQYFFSSMSSQVPTIISSLLVASSNTSSNSNSTSSICDERLFKLGELSREGYNATMVNNICPDSIFTPIVSAVFLFVYLCLVTLAIIGVLWKRNSGHIKARNPLHMILTISATLYFVVTTCLRFIIGRKIFPCFLYTISYFITVPAMCLPAVFRFIRIFFMYKLNIRKAMTFESSKHSASSSALNNNSSLSLAVSHITTARDSQSHQQDNSPSTSREALTSSRVVNFELIPTTLTEHQDVVEPFSVEKFTFPEITTTTNNNGVVIPHIPDTPLTDNNTSSHVSSEQRKSEVDSDTEDDSRSWVTSTDVDYTESVYNDRKFKVYSFLVSYKLIASSYIIAFILHLIIWAIFGGADELVASNGGKRVFLWNISMFAATTGCVTNTNTVFMLAAEAAIYIIIEIAFFIPLFFADRDAFHIKRDTFVLIVIQIITAIAFLVSGQIEVIRFLTDYFVPFGFTLLTYSVFEIFIAVLLPVIYAIIDDRKFQKQLNTENGGYSQTEIETVLKNRKTFALLLEFSRRCYCPEDVLAFRDIEKFRKISKKHKKKVATKILKTYLKSGSSLELNMSNLSKKYEEIETILQKATNPSLIPNTLFDDIRVLCLNNMVDVFERLKATDKSIQEMVINFRRNSLNL